MWSRQQQQKKKDPVVEEVEQFVKVWAIQLRTSQSSFVIDCSHFGLSQKDISAKYTFDSERGAPESELCRQPNGQLSKECRKVCQPMAHEETCSIIL